jgi:hypothetical protein
MGGFPLNGPAEWTAVGKDFAYMTTVSGCLSAIQRSAKVAGRPRPCGDIRVAKIAALKRTLTVYREPCRWLSPSVHRLRSHTFHQGAT